MSYLLAGKSSELERLQVQSRVWEPAGRALLAQIGNGTGQHVVDVGCGALGWLRVLSEWVGERGSVIGTDVDDKLLAAARDFVTAEGLRNVELMRDDIFDSRLPPGTFAVVHARFLLAPLGRSEEQVAAYRRLVARGGVIALEDPDTSSWRFHPHSVAAERLIALIREAFRAAGGDLDAGVRGPDFLRALGVEPTVRAHVEALPYGHPYLSLPLQFAASLRQRLLRLAPEPELEALLGEVQRDLARPGTWGTTFTVIQTWARFA